tara:strand:- start:744 stop:971 length:228 start_codon:yes stop_codon:yes gene_type:complete
LGDIGRTAIGGFERFSTTGQSDLCRRRCIGNAAVAVIGDPLSNEINDTNVPSCSSATPLDLCNPSNVPDVAMSIT